MKGYVDDTPSIAIQSFIEREAMQSPTMSTSMGPRPNRGRGKNLHGRRVSSR